MARNAGPAAREIPMQGRVAISSRMPCGVGLPQAGLTDPKWTAALSSGPQFIITQPTAPCSAAIRCFSCRAGW